MQGWQRYRARAAGLVMGFPWWQRAFLAFFVLSPALQVASYRAWADGPFGNYLPGVVFAVFLAALTWTLVGWQLPPGAILPWIAAAVVLVPGDVVHYRRLAHGPGATIDRLIIEGFTAAEPDGRPSAERWLVDGGPDASVRVEDGQLLIEDPPGAPGYIDLRMPPRPNVLHSDMTFPLGAYGGRYTEAVEWTAAVERQAGYFTMMDAQSVRLEVTGSGLRVTYRGPDNNGVDVDLTTPLPNDGQMHRYRMERTRTEYRLTADGQPLLSGVPAGHAPHWDFVRFGETRLDSAHGGSMRLDDVYYRQSYYAD